MSFTSPHVSSAYRLNLVDMSSNHHMQKPCFRRQLNNSPFLGFLVATYIIAYSFTFQNS